MEFNSSSKETAYNPEIAEAQAYVDVLQKDYDELYDLYQIATGGDYDADWAAELRSAHESLQAARAHLKSLQDRL